MYWNRQYCVDLTPEQVYAVVVGSMSAITALVLGLLVVWIDYQAVAILFVWEWTLVLLWAVLTGIFGSMYFNENPEGDTGVQRMKSASYLDAANLVMWALTAIIMTLLFVFTPRDHLHRGRAKT